MIESKYLKEDIRNIQKLMSIPLLSEFETRSLGELLKLSKIKQYTDGECIIEQGNTDPWLYFLLSGGVKIMKDDEVLAFLKRRGDIFGEMGMLGQTDRSASVYSIGSTTCLSTDAKRIHTIARDDKIAFNCLLYRLLSEIVIERLRKTNDELISAQEQIQQLTQKTS